MIPARPVSPLILLAAGGTGGHVFPAEALAAELAHRGYRLGFVTDARGKGFGGAFAEAPLYRIPAGTPTGRSLPGKVLAAVDIMRGMLTSWRLLARLKPAAVVGFGGYPSLPLMLAATQQRIASLIHEQNAVLGRVNRLVAKRCEAIAVSFPDTRFVPAGARAVLTGNPVRPAIRDAAGSAYVAPGSEWRLLVLGGSQGARIFSDIVPAALAALPADLRGRLRVVQQCRPEDLDRVRAAYAAAGIPAEISSFFANVADLMKASQLVISRSGASSTAEIAVIGRPSLLVPYAFATDDHQTANAAALVRAGAARMVAQRDFTVQVCHDLISELLTAPDALHRMAAAAATLGHGNAAARLADLVDQIIAARSFKAEGVNAPASGDKNLALRSVV